MKKEIKILFLEDNLVDLELIQNELKKSGITYIGKVVQNESEYIKALSDFFPDIILSDYNLPSFNGLTAFELKEKMAPDVPVIFISGVINEEEAIRFIRQGVTDYVLKDKLISLPVKIKRALKEKESKIQKANAELALVNSESRLKKAQEVAHLGCWELSFATGVAAWSDETCRIYGLSAEENHQTYESWLSFIYPDDLDFV